MPILQSLEIPPLQEIDTDSYVWREWYRKLTRTLNASIQTIGSFKWSDLDFTNSSLTNILDRDHDKLSNIKGDEYHLASQAYNELNDSTSGTYTPVSNIPGAVLSGKYKRIGNVYFVNIFCTLPISAIVNSTFTITLPSTCIFGQGTFQQNNTIIGLGYAETNQIHCPTTTISNGISTIFCTYTV